MHEKEKTSRREGKKKMEDAVISMWLTESEQENLRISVSPWWYRKGERPIPKRENLSKLELCKLVGQNLPQ